MVWLTQAKTTKTSLFPLLNQKVLSVEVRNPSLRWPIPDNVQKLVGQRLIGL
ncbi:DNA-formamidopyrimidine glycosylase, partial [Acinetobacter baumannii]|nr:DNA-formamidopyrimidine glycosylase [Acinetobacter baumannii]